LTNGTLAAAWSANTGFSYAGGQNGTLAMWNGGTWTLLSVPAGFRSANPTMRGMWGTSPTNVLAVGDGGWIMQCNPTLPAPQCTKQLSGGNGLLAIWGASPTNIYAVGGSGTIQHTTNGGGSWTASTLQGSPDIVAIWGSSATDMYLLTSSPTGIQHSTNGSTWTPVPLPRGSDPNTVFGGVWGTSASNVFIVGSHGGIWHFDGTRWQMMQSPTPLDLHAINGTGPADIYAVGAGGVALHYDGRAWMQMQPRAGAGDLRAVSAVPGSVLAVGDLGETTALVNAASACGSREAACSDDFDDDCDGVADACDSDCTKPTEQCANQVDDNCDGLVDCADPQCATDLACTGGGLCKAAVAASCGSVLSGTTIGGNDRIERYACSPAVDGGPDTEFAFSTPVGKTVTVTVMPANGKDLDVAVLGTAAATGACDPNGQCIAASSTPPLAPETVTFSAAANATYYLVVDGFARDSDDFTISISCN
jgi:hypothetical protein